MIPRRSIIKSKAKDDIGLHNTYDVIMDNYNTYYQEKYNTDCNIKPFSIGTPEDHILV